MSEISKTYLCHESCLKNTSLLEKFFSGYKKLPLQSYQHTIVGLGFSSLGSIIAPTGLGPELIEPRQYKLLGRTVPSLGLFES